MKTLLFYGLTIIIGTALMVIWRAASWHINCDEYQRGLIAGMVCMTTWAVAGRVRDTIADQ